MHPECRQFIKEVRRNHPEKFFFKHVLEVGSMYINGTVRSQFWFCKYTGLDIGHGKCVDRVCHGADWHYPLSYDTIISCEALEHDKRWAETLEQSYHNLKPGGLMIITCASTERAEHGTRRSEPESSPHTTDYYGNISVEMFREALPPHLFETYKLETRRFGEDLVFYGIKTADCQYINKPMVNAILHVRV